MTVFIHDGAHVKPGDVAFVVEGKVRSLLQTERIMLNIMQRMSGIATTTAKYQACLDGLKTKVLDTRKTTPGMRMLEKEAVKIGGGCNHRIGLFDMILIKDNHVDFAGGIPQAVAAAKNIVPNQAVTLRLRWKCAILTKSIRLLLLALTESCLTISHPSALKRP